MDRKQHNDCPDCAHEVDRRGFLKTAAAAAVSAPLFATARLQAAPTPTSAAETAVKGLYETLTDEQRKIICFDWNHMDPKRGLLRTHVSNNWQITEPHVRSEFYNKKQQALVHDVFKGIISPEWYPKVMKQLKDDTRGKEWGAEQAIAIFGKPGDGKFEFVMTGRHMTIRADGNSENHVAFGGPIFYGHAAKGFNEKPDHPGNVYWPHAQMANNLLKGLDKKQQDQAVLSNSPSEDEVAFKGSKSKFAGLPISELDSTQKKEIQNILKAMVAHYRKEDQDEALACLDKQGGLDKCSLSFYKDADLGKDGVYDNWRIEGPAFVWYFRGAPHVHVWVNVADDPAVKLNARG